MAHVTVRAEVLVLDDGFLSLVAGMVGLRKAGDADSRCEIGEEGKSEGPTGRYRLSNHSGASSLCLC